MDTLSEFSTSVFSVAKGFNGADSKIMHAENHTLIEMVESDGIDSLLSEWRARADELEDRPEEIKQEQDDFYKGSMDAARECAEPELKRKTVQACIDDLEESTTTDGYLESLADWREEVNELDKRILDPNEWFRKSIRKDQLEACIEDFAETLADDNFEECWRCGSKQMPVSDKRRTEGYRWKCEECSY